MSVPEAGGGQGLEFRHAHGIGCMAAVAIMLMAAAGTVVWWLTVAKLLYLRIVLAAVLPGLLLLSWWALRAVGGALWGRSTVRLEGCRVLLEYTCLGRTRGSVTVDMRGIDAILIRQTFSEGRVRWARISLLGEGGQNLPRPPEVKDALWFCRLLAARYGLQLRVVEEEEGASLVEPQAASSVEASPGDQPTAAEAESEENVQESLRDLAQQAPANVKVTLGPGGNGAVLECADSGCLFLLIPLTVAWLLGVGGLVWLLTSTSAMGGKIAAGWVAVCLVVFGWRVPRSVVRARWAVWRLTMERDRVVGARVLWGKATEVGSADMRQVEAIQLRMKESGGSSYAAAVELRGPVREKWPDLHWGCDPRWLARLAGACYGLPVEMIGVPSEAGRQAQPELPPPVPQEEVDGLGEPPRGVRAHVTGRSVEEGLEAVLPRISPFRTLVAWMPVIVVGLVFASAPARGIGTLIKDGQLWFLPVLLAFSLIGVAILLLVVRSIARALFGRTLVRIEEGSLRVEGELFGKRFGKVELDRQKMRHVRMPRKGGAVEVQDWRGRYVTVLPAGTRRDVALWFSKVIARWAEAPLRPARKAQEA